VIGLDGHPACAWTAPQVNASTAANAALSNFIELSPGVCFPAYPEKRGRSGGDLP
jgi:hypothetical protein